MAGHQLVVLPFGGNVVVQPESELPDGLMVEIIRSRSATSHGVWGSTAEGFRGSALELGRDDGLGARDAQGPELQLLPGDRGGVAEPPRRRPQAETTASAASDGEPSAEELDAIEAEGEDEPEDGHNE